MKKLLKQIRACTVCEDTLPLKANPTVSAAPSSKLCIIGQAPGLAVHQTGIPWNDKSGDNLRRWMNISKEDFYDAQKTAIMPMGFCYPGKGRSGDLPPKAACAPLWHSALLAQLPQIKLILLIGQYAQQYYLKEKMQKNLTTTVKHFTDYLPTYFVLPHPSPRNNIWMAKNPWFEISVLPALQHIICRTLK